MKPDKRINASKMSWKYNLGIFLLILWCCGSYMGVYALYMNKDEASIYMFLSLAAYLAVLSFLISCVLVVMRRIFLMKPLQYIGEGARKLASGDLSVRLQPIRKDGKKDEVEVLIEDFNIMAEELSSIELLKTDFISSVSHELKTPLSQISNYASILQSETLTEEEKHQYIEQIGESARKLSDLVTNILQLNRLDNQKIQPKEQRINLCEQLAACILGFDQLMDEKDIQLDFDMDEEIWIQTDAQLMSMVWNNLISNAIKFSEKQGSIRIHSELINNKVQISISDDGCGMDEQEVRHIFDKFYQADTSRKMNGNGIGLASLRCVIDLLQYEIKVKSVKGKGSTFVVIIPME